MPSPEPSATIASQKTQPEPVAVAMCTYQGSRFVEAQLQSLQAQSWPTRLHISDDASNDDTVARVSTLVREGMDALIVQPSNIGYVQNFQAAITAALDSGASYIALSDQDDVCHANRIELGMQLMHKLEAAHGNDAPLLVHSDLRLVDAQGEQSHPSFLAFRRYRISTQKNLPVILGENGVMGNTLLMNRALATLCMPFPVTLHVHDYWIALLAELFGHRALLDSPTVDYRLHSHNASNTAESMGVTDPFAALGLSWRRLLGRDFKLPFKEDSRLSALQYLLDNETSYPALDDTQRATVLEFVAYLEFNQPRWRSLKYLWLSGVARSGLRYRLRLCLATLLTQRYKRA